MDKASNNHTDNHKQCNLMTYSFNYIGTYTATDELIADRFLELTIGCRHYAKVVIGVTLQCLKAAVLRDDIVEHGRSCGRHL